MSKIIVENRTDLPDHLVLNYVYSVILKGRISGIEGHKQYCYHSSFEDGIEVACYPNKKSDRFVVYSQS